MKSLTAFVVGCIVIILVYVITAIVLQTQGVSLDTSLTVGMFGFFGTELAASAFIRISKNKFGDQNEEE